MIVAIMSSLPSGGVDVRTPMISPISDSVRRALAMSCADVTTRLAPLEQLAHRLGELALEALRIRPPPLTLPAARMSRRRRRARAPPGQRPPRAPPHRSAPTASRASTSLTATSASSSSSASRFGKVAIYGGPSDPGGLGDVVHARLLALEGEELRGSLEDRGGDSLLQGLSRKLARTQSSPA